MDRKKTLVSLGHAMRWRRRHRWRSVVVVFVLLVVYYAILLHHQGQAPCVLRWRPR